MSKKKPLIIVGGGGFSREVIWLAKECHADWDVCGVLDDNPAMLGRQLCDIRVLGTVETCVDYSECWFVIAVGSPRTRKTIALKMEQKGPLQFATLVHPSVMKSAYVDIGDGSIVSAGCILTTQISMGRHSIINLACTIGHDVRIGDYCTIAPRVAVSGNVTMGNGVELGTGSVLIQGLSLGDGSFVGAGAVVSKDIPDNIFAAGSPARGIKTLEVF
jgi:sugar O-acyltransferase (sialic acid O-acetyltransferase NeuD family)